MKHCRQCKLDKPDSDFDSQRRVCRKCRNKQKLIAYHSSNRDEVYKSRHRRAQLKCAYNMTLEQYESMYISQNGCCAICGKSNEEIAASGVKKLLCVDHDHTTGKVRGLLCDKCNRGIGMLDHNIIYLSKAIEYLSR